MNSSFSIAVHGGAGVIPRDQLSSEGEKRRREVIAAAVDAGARILRAGGPALEAVVAAVAVFEDAPEFNAGRGSVLNTDGKVQMDATVMCGRTRRAGAVAAIPGIRHPAQAALLVMEKTRHVLLAGQDASRFAEWNGLERMPDSWFITEERKRQLQQALKKGEVVLDHSSTAGTVGAVARDRDGHLAAATSTGGMTGKLPGRVGDSAVVGAGTWALDSTCAISATGDGERFILHHVAARVSDLMELGELSLVEACDRIMRELPPDTGGLIAVDSQGHLCLPFNSGGMYRGWIQPDGSIETAIW